MRKRNYLILVLLFGISLSGCQKEENVTSQTDPNLKAGAGMLKIAIVSDIHYMAPELLVNYGPAFAAYVAQDPKLLIESPLILQKFFEQLNIDKPDLLIIPGDLTKDGELISHQQIIDILRTQLDPKVKVLVLPGNHDIANPEALSFDGANTSPVPTISEEDFANMYDDFGYGDAISRDPSTLSYVAEPYKNFQIIFIDATIRPNPHDPNEAPLEGEITEGTLDWIDAQVAAATAKHMQVIAVMHHNLIDHWTGQSQVYPGFTINNSEEAAERLYQAGIQIIFTGHGHANDITTYMEGDLYDIQTGSTVSYPLPYRLVKYWNNDRIKIETKYIRGIDIGEVPIEDYAQAFTTAGFTGLFYYMLTHPPYSMTDLALAYEVAQLEGSAYVEFFAGDEVLTPEEQEQLYYYYSLLQAQGFTNAAGAFYLTFSSWNTDLMPLDNNITIDL